MTDMNNKPEQRHGRDGVQVQDTHDQKMQKLRQHLRRPITAAEANGQIHEHSGALRKYANLGDAPEHEFRRRLRELREARGEGRGASK